MADLAFFLLLVILVGVGAVWFAVTWPLLQWTLAWLERRRDAALAEINRASKGGSDD